MSLFYIVRLGVIVCLLQPCVEQADSTTSTVTPLASDPANEVTTSTTKVPTRKTRSTTKYNEYTTFKSYSSSATVSSTPEPTYSELAPALIMGFFLAFYLGGFILLIAFQIRDCYKDKDKSKTENSGSPIEMEAQETQRTEKENKPAKEDTSSSSSSSDKK